MTIDIRRDESGGYVLCGLSSAIDSAFELTVMVKVRINENTDTTRNTGEARFYLPTGQFLPLCENPHMASYPFNAKDGAEAAVEEFLSGYVEKVEPFLLLLTMVIPAILCRWGAKASIIERLRQS